MYIVYIHIMFVGGISNLKIQNSHPSLFKAVSPNLACSNLQYETNEKVSPLPTTKNYLISFNGISNDFHYAQSFMNQIAKGFTDRKKAFIIVNHIIPNSMPLIKTLNKSGRIAGIIAKPKSIDKTTYNKLQHKGISFLDITKENLCEPNIISKKINHLIKDDEGLIIVDIGGYFAQSLEQLQHTKNIIGIVEDTENGLQKYEKALTNLSDNRIPIYSIARSKLKYGEDYLVGRSIADSTLHCLKDNQIEYKDKRVGVIGFGEIGKGIAVYLKKYKNFEVQIFDNNQTVQKLAGKNGFTTKTKEELLNSSDILICATGNKSLNDSDLEHIKKGCFISSCTSSSDEFDFISTEIKGFEKIGHRLRNVNGIFFLNDGNAINFINPKKLGKDLSPQLFLTHSGLIDCCTKLDNNRTSSLANINIFNASEENALISAFNEFMKPNHKNHEFTRRIALID